MGNNHNRREQSIDRLGGDVNAADNSAAINDAINKAAAGDLPSKIYLPASYQITQDVELDSKVTLCALSRGAGLRTQNGARLITKGYDGFRGTAVDDGPFGFRLEHLTLDQVPLRIYGSAYIIEDVHIRNVDGIGFIGDAGNNGFGPLGANSDSLEAVISKLKIQECSQGALEFYGPHDSIFQNLVTALSSGQNAPTNVYIRSGGTQIHNSHIWGNGPGKALVLQNTGSNIISDTQIEGGNDLQLELVSTFSVQIKDSRIFGRGLPAQRGIVFSGSAGFDIDVFIDNCGAAAIDHGTGNFGHGFLKALVTGSPTLETGNPNSGTVRQVYGRVGGANVGSFMLNPGGTGLGFYGKTPIQKQTGVPVTDAGVHAAMVNLGLIGP